MPSDYTTHYTVIFWPLGSCSLTFEEWFTVIKLKLCLNLSHFNTHIEDSSKTLASQFLELLSSSEPVLHPCQPRTLPMDHHLYLNPSNTSIYNHPSFWQLPILYHSLPFGPQLHPPVATTIHCSSRHFFCLQHRKCHHFFSSKLRCLVQSLSAEAALSASSLELLHPLSQTMTSTLVKCHTQLTLVPVLMNLNVARR